MFEVVNRYDKYVLIVDGRSGSDHTAPLVIDLPAPPRLIRKWERRTPDVPATVTSNYLLDAGGVKVLVTVVVEETTAFLGYDEVYTSVKVLSRDAVAAVA